MKKAKNSILNLFTSKTRWLLVILVIALTIRVWGIDFGLPYLYHPDEPRYVLNAQHFFKTLDFDPNVYSDLSISAFVYLINALAYIPFFFLGKYVGILEHPTDIAEPSRVEMGIGMTAMSSTFLLGRLVSVLFGLGSVIIIFLIGKRLSQERKVTVGLLAALMLAVSPTNVAYSRYITPDTFVTFFILLAFLGAVLIFQRGRMSGYVLAGVATGLAVSTKANGAWAAIPIIVAHFSNEGLSGLKSIKLYLFMLIAGASFLLTTPFIFVDFHKVLSDFLFEARHYSGGHVGMEGNALKWYVTYLLSKEGPIVILGVIAILKGIRDRSRPVLLAATFPFTYFILISSVAVRNDRTVLPITPFLFLLAALLITNLQFPPDWSRKWGSTLRHFGTFLFVVSFAWSSFVSVKETARIAGIDGRETARRWIEDNLPEGSLFALEGFSPWVDPLRFQITAMDSLIERSPEWYVDNRVDYLVFSQGMFGLFYSEPEYYSDEIEKYEELFQAFELVRTFDDGGFEVRIYSVH